MSISQLNSIVGSITPQSNIVINTTKSNENFIAGESITLLSGAHLIADVSLKIGKMELINESFLSNIKYFDGLGRPIQSISIGQSPDGKDIVNHFEYDQFGRSEKSYLPLPSNQSTGNFISNPVSQINSHYQTTYGDTNPYSQQRFDNSPLSRVIESAQPGDDWVLSSSSDSDHTLKLEYGINEDNEVKLFIVENDLLTYSSYYNKGELIKNTSKNENWSTGDGLLNTRDVFTDKSGKRVAEFSYVEHSGTTKKMVTYYVYDNVGNLRFVLPPSLTDTFLNIIYDNYSTSWPLSDFLQEGVTSNSLSFEITSDIITINGSISTGGRLNSLTTKNIATNPNIPDMFLGFIIGATRFDIWQGWIYEVVGEIKIENTNMVVVGNGKGFVSAGINISKVLSNSQIPQEDLNNLAYQYKYDKYNRQIAQKMPGKAWQYTVFDQLDKLILTQDFQLRNLNQWMFTKYDVFGRVVYSGKYTSNLTQEELQEQVDSFIDNSSNKSNIESRAQTTNSIGGISINYSNNAFPNTNILEVTSVNYYDDYNFTDSDKPTILTNVLGQNVTTKTKGLPTASWSKTIGANTWTKSYPFYDHKTQELKVVGKNHLSGSTIVETEVDFTGKVKRVITNHKRESSSTSIQITDRFEYDHVGRLTNQYQQINNQQEERILGYVYNELGELTNKKVGGKSNISNPLQDIEYTRNIRGWLEKVNNPNQSLGNDLFAFEAKYNNPNSGGTPLYTGAITGVNWKSSINNNNLKTYDYQYDKLGRLSNAKFSSNTVSENDWFNVSNLNYDLNGNITSLSRNGWQNSSSYTNMDNLTYKYEGNKLTKVTDAGNNQYGFKDSNTTDAVDYEYDENGNLIRDNHKKMSITYNYLNLPSQITFDSG
ncbi:MAG: DUF6443 domain-containing protein [Tenacibaculum sp.]